MNNKTTIVSLFAGPGAGKSSLAAHMYSELKAENKNAELVREYVKDWAWESRKIETYDQIYFLGKQVRKESLLLGKVEVIITDSPVWLNAYYAAHHCGPNIARGCEVMAQSYQDQLEEDGHRCISLWVNRNKMYLTKGRYETEQQAKEIDKEMRIFLEHKGINFWEINSNFKSISTIFKDLELK